MPSTASLTAAGNISSACFTPALVTPLELLETCACGSGNGGQWRLVTPLELLETTTMKDDPGVEAVRRVRLAISRELDNDPIRMVAHYIELQKEFKERLLRGPEQGDDNDRAQVLAAPKSCETAAPDVAR